MKFLRLFLSVLFIGMASTASALTADLFYSPTCPHCHDAMRFIDAKLKKEYPNVNIVRHNVFISSEGDMMKEKALELGIARLGVPLFIVGDDFVSGFGSDETTGDEYRTAIDNALGIKKKR
ncbi:MAG: hypothetical protein JW812_02550 [Alphaproteobacteria bacterium]|nr:hypothetical protein [Alphaproteobacteria bacterium]MBN2779949.1 hypothetical protein [Alphaproteobacteria bacterium]